MIKEPRLFLESLIGQPESELVEFKLAERGFSERKLWDYFSALSNEANLHSKESAYFILGIDPKLHLPIHTTSWIGKNDFRDLKNQTHRDLGIGFREIYEVYIDNKRVLIFEIPACPRGTPVASNGFYYARAGESLVALDLRKLDEIRNQKSEEDWSNRYHTYSSPSDLDYNALIFLRGLLAREYSDPTWNTDSTEKVLHRLGLINSKGEINNTALLFLGKYEDVTKYLHPDICKITWRYTDEKNSIVERLPEPLYTPFILTIPKLIHAINRFNVTIGDLSIFREDIRQYDEKSIEEMIVNSLAHRDWQIPMWNEIIQTPDQLEIRNPGRFRAELETVLLKNYVKGYAYPNLCEFMTKIKLMERERRGLEKVYNSQLKKGLPITPDFLPERTGFILGGRIRNPDFAKALLSRTDISLEQLIILDKLTLGSTELKDSEKEKVGDFIEKQKRSNQYVLKKSFLQGTDLFDEHFLESHSSLKTKEQIFIDFAKKNKGHISTKNGYAMFPNEPSSSIRVILMNMENAGIIRRISRGKYEIVKKGK